jgi:tetratricopeptide (TPR) repeat protein
VSSGSALIGAALVLLATTACAPRQHTLASRFVTPGTPTIDLGGPTVNLNGIEATVHGRPARTGEKFEMPAPEPVREVGARHSGNLSTLEASSPELQRVLLALSLQPTTQRYLDAAAAYRKAGVRDKAFDYLSEGVRRDPTDPALHDALARAWRDWGFAERGLSAAHRAVYYAPQSAEARNTLGTVLWALGQRHEARLAFEQAAELDQDAWYAWRNLCQAALADGRTKDATQMCQRATTLRKAAAKRRR